MFLGVFFLLFPCLGHTFLVHQQAWQLRSQTGEPSGLGVANRHACPVGESIVEQGQVLEQISIQAA